MELFQFDFMVRAFVAGIATATLAPVIGMFLVVRRYSLIADTLAHVSLLGVALGTFFHIHPLLAAFFTAVVASVGIERLRAGKHMFGDAILALFLFGSLAGAIVLMSLTQGLDANLLHVLFGSVSTVSSTDLLFILPLTLLAFVAALFSYRKLFLISLDEDLARTSGVKAGFYNLLLVVLTALVVVIAMRVVGILLIGALMIIPVLAAMQYRISFRHTFLLAIAFSLVSMVAGLFLAYYFDLPSGGVVVLLALLVFVCSLIIGKR